MQYQHLQIEHRQRHRNRKDAVTERRDAAAVQLTLSETTNEMHADQEQSEVSDQSSAVSGQ